MGVRGERREGKEVEKERDKEGGREGRKEGKRGRERDREGDKKVREGERGKRERGRTVWGHNKASHICPPASFQAFASQFSPSGFTPLLPARGLDLDFLSYHTPP